MINEVFQYMTNWLSSAFEVFNPLFEHFNLYDVFISVLFVSLSVRFILGPIFIGPVSVGSDKVRKKKVEE